PAPQRPVSVLVLRSIRRDRRDFLRRSNFGLPPKAIADLDHASPSPVSPADRLLGSMAVRSRLKLPGSNRLENVLFYELGRKQGRRLAFSPARHVRPPFDTF